MVEYIEREAALNASDVYETFDGDDEIYFQYVPIEAIKELPAADVVPVVRCKDCAYAMPMYDYIICDSLGLRRSPLFFCANGERREDVAETN